MSSAEHSFLRAAVIDTACNRWQSAEANWTQCASLVPSLAPLFLADLAMRTGDIERALASLTLCEAGVPHSPYVERLRERAVTVQLRRAAIPDVVNPSALAVEELRKAARTAVECHRWPRAIELWTLFLERGGSKPEAYRRLGTCLQNLGDYANSVLHFREANARHDDPHLTEAIDRSARLEQRRFDPFLKHVQRFMQHPAFEVAQTAALAGATGLGQDLHTLSLVTQSPIAGSVAPGPPAQPAAVDQKPPATARAAGDRASVFLREIDLASFRPKAAAPPPVPASPPPRPVKPAAVSSAEPRGGVHALPLLRQATTATVRPQVPPRRPL